jgi:hypothetical protein
MRSETLLRALLALALCCAAVPASHAQTNDVALKAAYIYNIAQFTVWPAHAGTRPLNVCVGSAHPLWQSLRSLHGKPVGERKLAIVEPGAAPCDVAVLRAGAARPAADGNGMLAIRRPAMPARWPWSRKTSTCASISIRRKPAARDCGSAHACCGWQGMCNEAFQIHASG